VKTDKDRHILSAMQIFGRDSSFRQYKVCADIRSGSLERRLQTTVGLRVNARLEHLFVAFKNYCVKVNTDRSILYEELSFSSGTLVSGNIKLMRVFAGVL